MSNRRDFIRSAGISGAGLLATGMSSCTQRNGSSDATFKAATEALEGFRKQFEDLGGTIDENAAIEFTTAGTDTTILSLQDLLAQISGEQSQVNLDIQEAQAKLQILYDQIAVLKGQTGTDQWQIDLDIQAGSSPGRTCIL